MASAMSLTSTKAQRPGEHRIGVELLDWRLGYRAARCSAGMDSRGGSSWACGDVGLRRCDIEYAEALARAHLLQA